MSQEVKLTSCFNAKQAALNNLRECSFRLPQILFIIIAWIRLNQDDTIPLINLDERRFNKWLNVNQAAIEREQALSFLKGMNHAVIFNSSE